MSDTNDQAELRAAAGRLRSLLGCTAIDFENASADCVADMWRLAANQLAEHPADEQLPLTCEWIKSVGGEGLGHTYFYLMGESHFGARYGIVVAKLRFGKNAERWEVTFEGFPFRLIDTRGDLVRLCRELNIPINLETARV